MQGKLPLRATITDVAKQVGVSETTVSLSFRKGSRISDKTRKQVLRVANQLHYAPNLTARHLRQGKTKTVGVLVNDITNPFYSLMVRAVSTVSSEDGYEVLITDTQWDPVREVSELHRLIESRVEGVLACFSERTNEGIELLVRHGVPFIAMDTCPRGFKGSFVMNDLVETGRIAAEHLESIGCKHPVLFLPGSTMQNFSAFVSIRKGFVRTLSEKNLPAGLSESPGGGLTIQAGTSALESLMRASPDTDGVFCPSAMFALGVMEAADRLGISIGRQLALLGIDDLDICELSRVSLTAIRQPYEKLARLATHALIESLVADKPLRIRESLKPELIVRESTSLMQIERQAQGQAQDCHPSELLS